jgi:hypothetical protein
VANTASEAAAEAARNTFESGTSPATIARGIANDTFNVIAAQGENMTEATTAAESSNLTDFGYKRRSCGTINGITLENGELKRQV